jgi:hypothetical protein
MATADAFVTPRCSVCASTRHTLRDLRELIAEFSASISATLNLSAGFGSSASAPATLRHSRTSV